MRVAFFHPGQEPLGIELLAAVLKARGHTVALFWNPGFFSQDDAVARSPLLAGALSNDDDLLDGCARFGPEIAAFSAYTGTFPWCVRMARRVKRALGVPVVFGGIHATLSPGECLAEPAVDWVIRGEAEVSLPMFLDAFPSRRRMRDVPGAGYRAEGGAVVLNAPPPLAPKLDALPFPDRGCAGPLLPMRFTANVIASRGCPFQCSYCCEGALRAIYGARYLRVRSVGHVVEEIATLRAQRRFGKIHFLDAVFGARTGWLREFAREYPRRVGLPFCCATDVRVLTREHAKLLKDAGCYAVQLGMQSFDEGLRRSVNRHEPNEAYRRAVGMLHDVGVGCDIDIILGLRGDSIDIHRRAARAFSAMRGLGRVKIYHLSRYPGTGLAARCGDATGGEDRAIAAYERLYRVLPMLDARLVALLQANGLDLLAARTPALPWALAEAAGALARGNRRYYVVPAEYLAQLGIFLAGRLARASAGRGAAAARAEA